MYKFANAFYTSNRKERDDGTDLTGVVLIPGLVDAPMVGTISVEHLEQAGEALEVSLYDVDIEYIEKPYGPVGTDGYK